MAGIDWRAVLTALGFAALQLWMAATVPLVDDEGYYLLWSRVPSLGYYDHPPMIAWWIAGATALFGDAPWAVRLPSVLAGFAASLMVWRMARLCGLTRASALWAIWVFNAMPTVFALQVGATPDAPSLLFWCAGLWAAMEAARSERAAWWLAAGLFAGLGGLSKLTNLFLGAGLLLWAVATPQGRAALRRWPIWAGAGLAVAIMSPWLVWNLTHHGLGLERQLGRIGAGEGGVRLDRFLGFVATTFLLITPIIAVFAVQGLRRPFAHRGLLAWTSAPLVAFLTVHSLGSAIPGNWLLPVYPAVAVSAAVALDRVARGWSLAAVALGLGLAGLSFFLAFRPGAPIFPGNNPPNQAKGWDEAAAQIDLAARNAGATFLAADRYGLVGQLHAHLGDRWDVWGLDEQKRYRFRGSIPPEYCTAPGLLVTRAVPDRSAELVHPTGPRIALDRRSGNAVIARYWLVPFAGLKLAECASQKAGSAAK